MYIPSLIDLCAIVAEKVIETCVYERCACMNVVRGIAYHAWSLVHSDAVINYAITICLFRTVLHNVYRLKNFSSKLLIQIIIVRRS